MGLGSILQSRWRRWRFAGAAGAWALVVLLLAAVARADESGDRRAREQAARQAFGEALALADQGRWTAAAGQFERALTLRWSGELAYNRAAALERAGDSVRAHRSFAELARDPRARGTVRAAAAARAASLSDRVAMLVVRIQGGRQPATVLVDGREVPPELLRDGVAVAPGTRAIDVRAGSKKLPLRYARVRPGARHVVRVDLARDEGSLRPAWL